MRSANKECNSARVILTDQVKELDRRVGSRGMIQEQLAKGSLPGVVLLIQDFIQPMEVVNTDDVMLTDTPIVKEEDFLDGFLLSIRCSGEEHMFDILKAIDWEGLQESLETLLGILLIHFKDPGSGFYGAVERHIAGNELKIGELMVKCAAHVIVQFLARRAIGVDAKNPTHGRDILEAKSMVT